MIFGNVTKLGDIDITRKKAPKSHLLKELLHDVAWCCMETLWSYVCVYHWNMKILDWALPKIIPSTSRTWCCAGGLEAFIQQAAWAFNVLDSWYRAQPCQATHLQTSMACLLSSLSACLLFIAKNEEDTKCRRVRPLVINGRVNLSTIVPFNHETWPFTYTHARCPHC